MQNTNWVIWLLKTLKPSGNPNPIITLENQSLRVGIKSIFVQIVLREQRFGLNPCPAYPSSPNILEMIVLLFSIITLRLRLSFGVISPLSTPQTALINW